MRRPGAGNLRHRENNAARANAGYSAPAGRGLPSAVDFDPLLDPAWPPSPYSPSTLWGPCRGTSWMPFDDGALNLYDANGSPLLGNPSHHVATDVLAVHPSGRVALAVGRAGGLPCSTSSKVTAALEGLRCSGRRTSGDALYRRITR